MVPFQNPDISPVTFCVSYTWFAFIIKLNWWKNGTLSHTAQYKIFAVFYHNVQGFTTFGLKYPNSPKKLAAWLLIQRSLNLATVNTRPSYSLQASIPQVYHVEKLISLVNASHGSQYSWSLYPVGGSQYSWSLYLVLMATDSTTWEYFGPTGHSVPSA